ncbi:MULTISPECIES: helix-turn-helix domain-containing protein [Paenibacillus]|uniref:helix-turn-helix domain-containing protein n=1 Tax=Paenibacillus TaxID=44249 RepID=UPI0022B8818C|nr:helix-turn-helix domain-containing protein [Paenibacillus caseinilyticus]MCZ8523161.1 helix-turn-helix domain-containing protein [Paenibacillus caseinilyticus]
MLIRTLLIAHGQPFFRTWLRTLVESSGTGWKVAAEAGDGAEAWEQIRITRPHLILSDLSTPGLEGADLARRLQELQPSPLLIILAEEGDLAQAESAWAHGLYDMIVKPCSQERLSSLLRRAYVHSLIRERRLAVQDSTEPEGADPSGLSERKTRWKEYLQSGKFGLWKRETLLLSEQLAFLLPAEAKLEALRLVGAAHAALRRQLGHGGAPEFDYEAGLEQLMALGTSQEAAAWAGSALARLAKGLGTRPSHADRGIIRQSLSYLQEHYMEPCSASFMAERFHMSQAYFSKLFKRETGETFSGCLTRLRMEQAERLLTGTDLLIAEVAAGVGYDDPNYFASVFRDRHGVPPSEFRKNHRGALPEGSTSPKEYHPIP